MEVVTLFGRGAIGFGVMLCCGYSGICADERRGSIDGFLRSGAEVCGIGPSGWSSIC